MSHTNSPPNSSQDGLWNGEEPRFSVREMMGRTFSCSFPCETHSVATTPKEQLVRDLVRTWRSAIVTRSELNSFSGGLLNPRTMANRDSQGRGIKPKFSTSGGRIFYRTCDAARYIADMICD